MEEQTRSTRECPYCKEDVKAEALKCKHCNAVLTPDKPPHGGTCPYCKEEIKPEAIKCKHCKSDLSRDPGRVSAPFPFKSYQAKGGQGDGSKVCVTVDVIVGFNRIEIPDPIGGFNTIGYEPIWSRETICFPWLWEGNLDLTL